MRESEFCRDLNQIHQNEFSTAFLLGDECNLGTLIIINWFLHKIQKCEKIPNFEMKYLG